VSFHRGTAYFAQRLAELSDDELDGATLLEGWTRRHLLAHVGYNAAALCRLLDWAATGVETPMYESAEQRNQEVLDGATQNPAALRNFFDHTVARLDRRWRDLPEAARAATVRTAQGRLVPASEVAWMRSREVWVHAVDLANGGQFSDFPEPILESLLSDAVTGWRRKELGTGLVLAVAGRTAEVIQPDSTPTLTVCGPLPGVVRWATGRGDVGVSFEGPPQAPPRWL
jgi:maleylpyruvate isomerase